ncbi:efflux transporter outer membrane subunit [Pseudomonas matsuisoli]|uniref:Outer membrane protein OprM n=1 Tax=Pseudomonas matsuisoli TaxID=1515666 RepID=A0A917UZV7_9PSED|nr:efflux transporter outer membrane subunit [Pseudomonas matsuisoli]GGK04803.1 outer membrane protein OprM [Pseudomonas matsuisoli]
MRKSLIAVSLSVVISGCTLIPEYERPNAPIDNAWPQGEAYAADAANSDVRLLGWEEFFQDPALKQLVGIALENNRDLRAAALNVQSYEALYRIQRAQLFPSFTGDAAGTRTRTPSDLSYSGQSTTGGQYSATLGVSWEIDLFGRLRSLNEQALQQYFATEAGRRATQISLISSVATAYLTWQADQALLQLSRDTLGTYDNSLRITQRSFDVGVATSLELRQAQTAVNSARASVARYTRQVAQDQNSLNVLLGGAAPAGLLQQRDLGSQQLAQLPVGLPSSLLNQRPDLLQAEYQLKAANANIGALRAALFPNVSLTGSAGTASSQLSGLFDAGSGYWNFAPQISVPIFSAGRLRAEVDYATLQKDVRVAEYEQAVQGAFQEVADGLAARRTYVDQVQAQRDLVESTQGYYDLADRRYRTGVDSYLTLLDAQRELFTAQQQLITDRLSQLTSEIDLFRALGGGWDAQSQVQAKQIPDA